MKKERKRKQERAAQRQFDKRLSKARGDADRLRKAHSMCECGDDERIYFFVGEIDADRTPRIICDECLRPKLRVAILRDGPPRPLPENGELFIKDILRRED
ncbi:MAG TPA: hypothetical protein VFV58_24060 [Blastocatellia bacterium]|jgi:hypothetical protein|nr:hypothetical protein [Blastocatellia bacterium]